MLSLKRITEKRFKRQWPAETVICLITFLTSSVYLDIVTGRELYCRNTNKILLIQRRKKFPIPQEKLSFWGRFVRPCDSGIY